MDLEALKGIGLTDNEIKVYITLLETDASLASAISKKTNINRSLTYEVLTKLIEKGMISYVLKENKRYYKATNPKRLMTYLKEKQDKVSEIIPTLLNLKRPEQEEIKVEIYKGKEGYKTILEDFIKTAKEYYFMGWMGTSAKILPYFYKHWLKRREKAKVKRYILTTSETIKDKETEKYLEQPLTKIKILPKKYRLPSSTCIYGNKVAIFLIKDKEFTGIMIESKEIQQAYKTFFDFLWVMAKEK